MDEKLNIKVKDCYSFLDICRLLASMNDGVLMGLGIISKTDINDMIKFSTFKEMHSQVCEGCDEKRKFKDDDMFILAKVDGVELAFKIDEEMPVANLMRAIAELSFRDKIIKFKEEVMAHSAGEKPDVLH